MLGQIAGKKGFNPASNVPKVVVATTTATTPTTAVSVTGSGYITSISQASQDTGAALTTYTSYLTAVIDGTTKLNAESYSKIQHTGTHTTSGSFRQVEDNTISGVFRFNNSFSISHYASAGIVTKTIVTYILD